MRRTKVVYESGSQEPPKKRRKAMLSPEARDNQLIALTYDLVEKRIREGTASSQETVHFLKLAARNREDEELERDILRSKKAKLDAEVEAIQSQRRTEELYADALKAMSLYRGSAEEEEPV